MMEWYVLWATESGHEGFVVLPSFWKVLLWFLCTARRCTDIRIFTA